MKRIVYFLTIIALTAFLLSSCVTEETVQGEPPIQSGDTSENGDESGGNAQGNNDGNNENGEGGQGSGNGNDGSGSDDDGNSGNEDSGGSGEEEHQHTKSEWITDAEPTCTEPGSKHIECTECFEILETSPIDAEGHTFENDGEDDVCTKCNKAAVKGLKFEENEDGTYTVVGIGTYSEPDLIIPSHNNNMPVVAVAGCAFESNLGIRSVEIPNTVTIIGESAFKNCHNIISISFGNGLKEIHSSAFTNCTSLIEVSIPASVTVIEGYYGCYGVFEGCISLKKATIGNSSFTEKLTDIGMNMFKDCISLESVYVGNNVGTIGTSAFEGCCSLNSLSIGRSVKRIGDHAFYDCNSITNVQIPASVEKIESGAFELCSSLNSVKFVHGLKEIGDSAFAMCTSLTEIYIPSSVTVIEGYYGYYGAFEGCTSLKKATIGNALFTEVLTDIGMNMFKDCISLESVYIGNNVGTIGTSAFEGCCSLNSLSIGSSVKQIYDHAFFECTSLTNVKIPASVEKIYDSAFEFCSSLNNVEFAYGLKEIGTSAFAKCTSLTEVNLPSSVTDTESGYGFAGTFEGCTNLKKATIGDDTVTNPLLSLAMNMFKDCTSLEEVYVGSNVFSIGQSSFEGCSSLKSVCICNNIKSIEMYAFKLCTSLPYIIIPNSVEYLFESAFEECKNLEFISFGQGLRTIEDGAFAKCTSLTEVTIPANVKLLDGHIGFDGVFEGCTSLKKVTIGTNFDTEAVTDIGITAFKDCTALEEVYLGDNVKTIGGYAFEGCTSLSKVVLGNNIDSICYGAFMDCSSLVSLTIPGSVTNIENEVFCNCTSLSSVTIEHLDGVSVRTFSGRIFEKCPAMTRIFYTGTAKDWKAIIIDSDSLYPLNLTPYYYSEEDPGKYGDYWYYNSSGDQRVWNVSEKSFNAAYSSRHFVEIFGDKSSSYSNLFLEEFLNDDAFQKKLNAWKGIHIVADFSITNPTTQMSEDDFYKVVIYDLLCGEVNAKNDLMQFITGSSDTYFSSLVKDIFGKNIDPNDLKTIPCSDIYKPNTIMLAGAAFDLFMNASNNMYEALTKCAMHCTLSEMDVYFRDVLVEISNDQSVPYDLRCAANECIELFRTPIENIKTDLLCGVLSATPDAIMSVFLDKVWDTLIFAISEPLSKIQNVAKGFIFLNNVGFNIDNSIAAYYKLTAAVHLENALRNVIHNVEPDYMRVSNRLAGDRYIYSIDLYKTSVLLGFDYSNLLIDESSKKLFISNSRLQEYKAMMEQIKVMKEEKSALYEKFDNQVKEFYKAYYLE